MLRSMILASLVFAAGCSSKKSKKADDPAPQGSGSAVAETGSGAGSGSAAGSGAGGADTPDPAAPAAPSAALEDLVAKLPKQDFAPAYAKSTDAEKTKAAQALYDEAVPLKDKSDWAGAEAKLLEALAADPGHEAARYLLASVQVRAEKADRGLALLVELQRCDGCEDAFNSARWDDDWRSQWDRPVFWQIGRLAPEGGEPAPGGDAAKDRVTCADGTTRKEVKTGKQIERFCLKGKDKHGLSELIDEAEGIDVLGEFRDGKQHGLWTTTRKSGDHTELSEGAFIDGEKHGLWTTDTPDRQSYDTFVNGKQEGLAQTHVRGFILSEVTYAGGELEGPSRTWSEAAEGKPPHLVSEGVYKAGKQDGVWTSYDEDGKTRELTFKDGVRHGPMVGYSKGVKTRTGHYEDGVRHGEFEYFHDGKSIAKITIDKGNGEWVRYRGDEVTQKGKLENDKRVGKWGIRARGTDTWAEGEYKEGKRVGPWTVALAADHAKKIAEGAFADDKRQGAWTFWREDGTKLATGSFVGGVLDGAWTLFDDKGEKPAQQLAFAGGKLTKIDGKAATPAQQEALPPTFGDKPEVLGASAPAPAPAP